MNHNPLVGSFNPIILRDVADVVLVLAGSGLIAFIHLASYETLLMKLNVTLGPWILNWV